MLKSSRCTHSPAAKRAKCVAATLALSIVAASASADEAVDWLSGVAFRQALDAPADYTTQRPLRDALTNLAAAHRTCVWLDRRIDPSAEQRHTLRGGTLRDQFETLARQNEAAAAVVGPVVYLGPKETVDVLATVVELRRQEARKLPAASRNRVIRTRAASWKKLSTPQSLLAELERESDVRIVGKENVPHDLWPAGDLPPLDFAQRLSLLLAGFHVTFEWSPDGSAVRLVKMPQNPTLKKKYRAGNSADSLARQLKGQFPDAQFTATGDSLAVAGRWEVHQAVDRLLKGETVRRPPADEGEKNYTLTVTNKPVGALMKALGQQMNRPVQFDADNPVVLRRLRENTDVSVKEASLDELLKAVLQPVGLKYELRGETIFVTQ